MNQNNLSTYENDQHSLNDRWFLPYVYTAMDAASVAQA